MFEFFLLSGSKGKFLVIVFRSVNIYFDLDLIGGFVFLFFVLFEYFEDYIE